MKEVVLAVIEALDDNGGIFSQNWVGEVAFKTAKLAACFRFSRYREKRVFKKILWYLTV